MVDIDTFFDSIREKTKENKLIEAEEKTIKKWNKLKHTKECLELFLGYNLAKIQFTSNDGKEITTICTGFIDFINRFSLSKKERNKLRVKPKLSNHIRTNKKTIVDTWDLINNDYFSINTKNKWKILHCIEFTKDNLDILIDITRELLSKNATE